jgi:small-conductance mechanosensitive channel
MGENSANFWGLILKSLNGYWEGFLLVLPRFVFAIIILLVTCFIASQLNRLARAKLTGKTHDPLFGKFVSNLIKYTLFICCVILFLHILGLTGIAGGLLAGEGISAIIFGFAFKDIAENFLAGIILAFDRPFTLNDTVRIGDQTGHVVSLNFRTTHIKTFDEKDVFIPNSKIIKETLVNLTKDGIIRINFLVGIAYEDDIPTALDLIVYATGSVEAVLKDKKPFAVVEELDTNSVNIRVFFCSETDDYKKGILLTSVT